ncbi:MAG: hypothetical protein EOO90_05695 [Pedobacter sp.]|nr:MAG: hypothetical protein EOO90_05695 [Pedobacter sp.]
MNTPVTNRKKLILGLLGTLALTFQACQSKPGPTQLEEAVSVSPSEQSCYSYTLNRDTASLTLIISGHVVAGNLNYSLYEKDKNTGKIKGELRGDTLVADYEFSSEGSISTRQVAFLKKDGKWVEGFGEVLESDGKTVFKNLSKLKFENQIVFTKVDCK